MLGVVASVLAMVCKRMQQQPTLLGSCCVCVSSGLQTDATTHQQCWELLRPCWHRCANGPKNSQQCWDLQCIVGRIQLIWLWRPCVMRVRGPNNVGRAVQTDPTLLRYASAITEQKKCWELLARKFDRFQTLCNNPQQHAKRTQHVTSNKIVSCWLTMSRPFSWGLSVVQWNPANPPPVNITTLFLVSFLESPVKKQARKGVWKQWLLAQYDNNCWFP